MHHALYYPEKSTESLWLHKELTTTNNAKQCYQQLILILQLLTAYQVGQQLFSEKSLASLMLCLFSATSCTS